MESADQQPDSPAPTASLLAKPGFWKQSPDLAGRAAAGATDAAAPTALPPSPFSLVAPPAAAAAYAPPRTLDSLVVNAKVLDSRHSGGGAATDSASSDATQLAAVHAAPVVGQSPASKARGWDTAAPPRGVLAGGRQWGISALPDGLSGLVESSIDRHGQRARPQLLDSAMSQMAQGTSASQQRSAANPTEAVIGTTTAALSLAAEQMFLGGGQRQLAALSQGSAGIAAAAAAAAHLTLQGASPLEAAQKILAMVQTCTSHITHTSPTPRMQSAVSELPSFWRDGAPLHGLDACTVSQHDSSRCRWL